ncbi:MAG: pantetheine-phosphate adenylyltransferase [Candidatus Eisenbacteria bacterium]|nr:pantetheine-phosphate adenylyltransferase [Candidatus Eisenbacteria bacterium]
MRTALYPGTFDPITNGHLDLIRRARKLFDRIVVAVGTGRAKTPMFSERERLALVRDAVKGMDGVEAVVFSGLLVDVAARLQSVAIIRGLREVSDFEYEFQMALMNRRLAADVETVFLMPSERFTYIDSTVVKEVGLLGGSVDGLVPPAVERALAARRKRTVGRATRGGKGRTRRG